MNLFTKNALSKRENIRKWVKALRSGKYRQVNGVLYDGTGYCCLGVGCVVQGFEPKVDVEGCYEFCGDEALITGRARAGLGLATTKGYLPAGCDHESLVNMNDNGRSFREIATTINREFKRQFGELP